MSKLLEHKGVIVAIEGKLIEVEFARQDACASCLAKGMCGQDSGEKRFVTLHEPLAKYYEVGEEVMLGVEQTMGLRAATMAYIVPFFVLLGSLLLGLQAFGWSETVSGLVALGLLALYYIVLWLFRRKIEKEIVFKIRKI